MNIHLVSCPCSRARGVRNGKTFEMERRLKSKRRIFSGKFFLSSNLSEWKEGTSTHYVDDVLQAGTNSLESQLSSLRKLLELEL